MNDSIRLLLVEHDDHEASRVDRDLAAWSRHDFLVDRVTSLDGMFSALTPAHELVLLDLSLPGSCGLETLREVMVHAEERPVIVLAGDTDGDLGLQALKYGAQDCLPKRDRPGNLGRAVAYALERHRLTAEVRLAAVCDDLTGLPNRALMTDRLGGALRRARRRHEGIAVLYLDLDRFKPINDRFGHAIGDLVLQKVSARMQRCLRAADTVARVGGDEFVCILESVEDAEAADAVARKLQREISRAITIRNCETGMRLELSVDVSIGIALSPSHASTGETLLRCADHAMYRAKGTCERVTTFAPPPGANSASAGLVSPHARQWPG